MARRKTGKVGWFVIGVIVGLLLPVLYQAYRANRPEEVPGSVGIIYVRPLYAAYPGTLDSLYRVGSSVQTEEALRWVWRKPA